MPEKGDQGSTMLKRKTLTLFIAVTVLAMIAGIFAVKTAAVRADESTGYTLTYGEGENSTAVTGIELPDGAADIDLIIPEGVTAIADNAFEDCNALNSVTLPEGIKSIGSHAFANTSVTSINIPASVNIIYDNAFNGCINLMNVDFAESKTLLTIQYSAFKNCKSLNSTLNLPAVMMYQGAFEGCNSLRWVYIGEQSSFASTADLTYFPTDTPVKIVFRSAGDYKLAQTQADATFWSNNGKSATYLVNVNCYIGESETPVVYERLHGNAFNYVADETGSWGVDTAHSTLPVQDASYSSTVWYGDETLKNKVSYEDVNKLLETESEVNLYCHETIPVPVFPAEPVSWVQSDDISYDITSKSQILKALGCEQEFTDAQLAALDFTVTFADGNGEPAETPDTICGNGVYSVKISLKSDYGSWAQDITSSVTVNLNTNGFTVVMIVLLVVGLLAVIITVSTAVIRKKVQARNRKKQLSQKEVLEKFKAVGGETTLK